MITILLATYNGYRFLPELLDSLIAQTFEGWDLYIRDDNSTDGTQRILSQYEQTDNRIHVTYGSEQLGPTGNFLNLVNSVSAGNYLMLCDQDDVWLPDKIEKTYAEMQKQEADYGKQTALMVYCGKQLVDQDLLPISSFKSERDSYNVSLHDVLIQNPIYGCTLMINRAALDIIKPVPEYVYMHDYYFALVVSLFGIVVYLDEPLILYRQHSGNVTGGAANFKKLSKLKSMSKINNKLHQIIMQNYIFCKTFSYMGNEDLNKYESMIDSNRIQRMFKAGKFKYSIPGKLQTLRLLIALATY